MSAVDSGATAMLEGRSVGIFRLQLFKASEIFIHSQAGTLARYRPLYIGRRLFSRPSAVEMAVPAAAGKVANALTFAQIALMRRAAPFVKAMAGRRPQLLHAHFAIDAVFALDLAKRLKVPLITTLHGFDVTRSDWDMLRSARPSLIQGMLGRRRLQSEGRLFICVSEFIKRAALARGFPADRLLVHYIGIDCSQLQAREGAGEDDLLVHVGRLVEKKGTTYLLQALVEVRRKRPQAQLVIIGDGPLRAALDAEVARLGLTGAVRFLGTQPNPDVLRWIARAAVMIVPSVTASDGDMEGFGIVNIEAGAQGVPVVGFDSGGVSEAIKHGYSGLLSPERDVEGLAASITHLLEDSSARQQMGANARSHVLQNFNIVHQTAALEALYDDVLRGR
jgi:colanic acid/amylovoran biosynthesis glycosyltransferase